MSAKGQVDTEAVRDAPYENPSYFEPYRHELTRIESELFGKYLREGDRVLDVACGVGRVSLQIAPRVREVVGIDVSRVALDIANETARASGTDHVRFLRADVSALPEGFVGFDRVLIPYNSLEAIHGRSARRRTLAAVGRALDEEGVLLFCVHNRGFYRTRLWLLFQRVRRAVFPSLANERRWAAEDPPMVVLRTPDRAQPLPWYLYSLEAVQEDLAATGFTIIETVPTEDQDPTTTRGLAAGRCSHRQRWRIPGYYLVCRRGPQVRPSAGTPS